MLYNCRSCSKRFRFPDAILFCPYCGEILFENAVRKGQVTDAVIATDAIDSIFIF